MAFEIGYRRPPPDKQFKKGSSGNPRGRPKGSKNFSTLLQDELDAKVVINEGGRKKTVTRLQAMVKRLVASALQGDPKAVMTLLETLRRTGQLNPQEQESWMPDDYESLLDEYVQKQSKKAKS